MTSREDAMAAVSVILKYIEGDDTREGLVDTPKRVLIHSAKYMQDMKWMLQMYCHQHLTARVTMESYC